MIWLISLLMLGSCVPVRDSVLHGRDLAEADVHFAAVDPDTALGYAPVPGSRRVISEAEMTRLAKRFGIDGAVHEACFQYAMTKLDPSAVKTAMEEAIPGAQIEVLETGKFEVPEGKTVFSVASLPKPPIAHPDEPVIWRGSIEYAPNRRFTIWAKVRVARTDMAVQRGDEVVVQVEAGGARIKISARAESQAALGETVKLRNPKSGKVFEARVTGKGSASLIAPAVEEGK